MNYSLVSLKTSELNKNKIIQISKLKDSQWSFGINSQIGWFKKNIKKNDIHNLLYLKSKLIGYTLLRKRTCKIENSKKNTQYLLFDTIVIDKKYRDMKLSYLLMSFNNTIIKQSGFISFLICSNKLVSFYMKHDWKKLNKKTFNVVDYPFSSTGMVFNKKKDIKKYIFYINN